MTVLPHNGLSDHNCLCISILTKFAIDLKTTKVSINKSERINYVTPFEFVRKLRSPVVQEKIALFFETCKNKDDVSCNKIYSDFVEIFSSCALKRRLSLPK